GLGGPPPSCAAAGAAIRRATATSNGPGRGDRRLDMRSSPESYQGIGRQRNHFQELSQKSSHDRKPAPRRAHGRTTVWCPTLYATGLLLAQRKTGPLRVRL